MTRILIRFDLVNFNNSPATKQTNNTLLRRKIVIDKLHKKEKPKRKQD